MITMHSYLNQIDAFLEQQLRAPQEVAQKSVLDAMRYSMTAGGKRLRPVLTLEWCRLAGGDVDYALPFACALEMIHCSSLIHDDLPCMDDDDFRRGKPSCHKVFGEDIAVLAGDALIVKAFELCAQGAGNHADRAVKAAALLAERTGTMGMIGGQVIDLESEGRTISYERLQQMHALKTGALIRASCVMGVICAGGEDAMCTKADQYAQKLGLAFQIIDDILDVTGDEQEMGKPIGSDAANGKTTFVTLLGLDASKKMAEKLSNEAVDLLEGIDRDGFLTQLTQSMLRRTH